MPTMITYRKRTTNLDGSKSPDRSLSTLEFQGALTPHTSSMLRRMKEQRRLSNTEMVKVRLSSGSVRPSLDTLGSLRYSLDSVGSLRYSRDSFDLEVLEEEEENEDDAHEEEHEEEHEDEHEDELEEEERRGSVRTVHHLEHSGEKDHQNDEQQSDEKKPLENSTPVDGSVGDDAEKEEAMESHAPNPVDYSPEVDDLEETEQTENDDEVRCHERCFPLLFRVRSHNQQCVSSPNFDQQSTEEEAPDDESPCTSLRKALDSYLESLDLAVEAIEAWETRKSEIKREMNELNDVTE